MMFPSFIARRAPDDPAKSDAGLPRALSGRVLARQIVLNLEDRLAHVRESEASFRTAFGVFAESYFTLVREEDTLYRPPAVHEPAVEALDRVFSEALESGALATLPASPRLTAVMTLTSLAALQDRVIAGALAPAEAADLLVTVVFDGLQAVPGGSSRDGYRSGVG